MCCTSTSKKSWYRYGGFHTLELNFGHGFHTQIWKTLTYIWAFSCKFLSNFNVDLMNVPLLAGLGTKIVPKCFDMTVYVMVYRRHRRDELRIKSIFNSKPSSLFLLDRPSAWFNCIDPIKDVWFFWMTHGKYHIRIIDSTICWVE